MRFHFSFNDMFRFLDMLQDDPARAAMGLFCFLALALVVMIVFSLFSRRKK